ncbi:MAG: crossover junction endodeoxyribonuclease RuvC [Chloroflexi bacterium]|nr:crossover junction endodeoxyribonuclease RuvC [Chloroflexota bacterium]
MIGIDPGTAITGFGIIEENLEGSLQVLEYGVIRTEPNLKPEEKLASIYTQLGDVISHQPIESAAVERLFFQKNTKTALSVGEARGVILLALTQNGIPLYEYNPVDIKQAVTGYGRADKPQMQQMVKVLLALHEIPRPDDAADALAIAICHIHQRKFTDSLSK